MVNHKQVLIPYNGHLTAVLSIGIIMWLDLKKKGSYLALWNAHTSKMHFSTML